jgi:hypothetical protein
MTQVCTRRELLESAAKSHGLSVHAWSPGDGLTRYRFGETPNTIDYFQHGGLFTALGIREAEIYLAGYARRVKRPSLVTDPQETITLCHKGGFDD